MRRRPLTLPLSLRKEDEKKRVWSSERLSLWKSQTLWSGGDASCEQSQLLSSSFATVAERPSGSATAALRRRQRIYSARWVAKLSPRRDAALAYNKGLLNQPCHKKRIKTGARFLLINLALTFDKLELQGGSTLNLFLPFQIYRGSRSSSAPP